MSNMALSAIQFAAAQPPSGGAAIGEIVIATVGAGVITAVMVAIVLGHRTGRLPQIGRIADFAERNSGIPGWASLPLFFVAGALLLAVLGMYWDISIHLDEGRDEGPLANTAHYFILIGLFAIFFAGLLSVALPKGEKPPSRAALKITDDWHAPLGGALMCLSSAFALLAFPLDDVWHRIFGQDVTLWGPTHLVLIGGAGLATVGALILLSEGLSARGPETPRERPRWLLLRRAILAGAFLTALSTFQAEFDFSVPQFRLVWHPILLMIAAGIGLIPARLLIGRGGALLAVAFFILIRGLLSLYVGPLAGHTTLHFPLYIVEALAVEAVALFVTARRPVRFGLIAGAAIGTFGLAAEWLWSHIWWTIPWTDALLPEGAIAGFVAAVAAGAVGGWVGGALNASDQPRTRELRWAPAVGAAVIVGLCIYATPMSAPPETTKASFDLQEVTPNPERTVNATIRLDPPDAADDAEWLNITGWQGGGSVVDDLDEIGDGVYRTTQPIPVYGNWKVTLRLHKDDVVASIPFFMPADSAIPVKEIPAKPQFTRPFVLDSENLLREQKDDVPGWLRTAAYLVVLLIAIGLLTALGWGLARFASRAGRDDDTAPPEPERAEPKPQPQPAGQSV
jgi:hypothetical protein